MSKYEALTQFLKGQWPQEVPMSFAEIERVVGVKLPRSAHVHRPWWSNNPSNSAMTKAWLEAGFRTERVDMSGKTLVFRRIGEAAPANPPAGFSEAGEGRTGASQEPKKSRRHPLFGALKGTFTIDPDWDLTKPAMPEWADLIDEKYGPETRK
jgi:hypothetical protein